MKKKFLILALALSLSVSATAFTVAAPGDPSPGTSTNESTDRGSDDDDGDYVGGINGVPVTAEQLAAAQGFASQQLPAQGFAASTNNGTTTTTAEGATKTSETTEISIEGTKAIYDNGTVEGAGLDLELQSAVATIEGVTYTTLVNRGIIDGKTVDYKFQLVTIGGRTAGFVVDPATNQFTNFTGDLTIVLADGSKKLVHVINGQFVA